MTDLGSLAQHTADRLAEQRVTVVVAAVAGDAAEIRGAGGAGGAPGDTLFEIGSVTKVFTALALARLAVAGTVRLDEPLADLLPPGAVVPARDGRPITLRHLATHTSGLPRLPTGMLLPALLHPSAPDPYATCSTDRLLRALARARPRAAPGHRFRYSNFGAGLLGLALAHRAGTSYEELIAREIGAPLGLTRTGVTVEPLTPGHTRRRAPTPAWHLAVLAGAGGLRSTATDLVTFVRAQLGDGGPLADAVRLSREGRHRINPFAWVHLGWMGRRLHPRQGGHLQLWHNGSTGGFSAFTGCDPETGVAVVVLSDTQRPVDREASELLRSLQAGAGRRTTPAT